MANQQALSEEEAQLKRRARRRLIGAITLVTVLVVTLPWVLDGEPKLSGQQDIIIDIPPQNSGKEFSSKIVPVPEQPKAQQAHEPVPAPVQDEKPAPAPVLPVSPPQPVEKKTESTSAKAESKKSEAPADLEPVNAQKPAAAPAEPLSKPKEAAPSKEKQKEEKSSAKPEGGPFVIQLGAFANMNNAKERQAKLTALKIKFYTETIKTPGGDKLRVRAGPYATRQEAERVQAKLKASGIQDGMVADKKG